MSETPNLYGLTPDEIERLIVGLGAPRYRARQLWHALYRQLAPSFEALHPLPGALRERLAEVATLGGFVEVAEIHSSDGHTRKWLLELPDRERIEAVLMAYDARDTACISVQVGCAYACAFCATGRMGLVRNLSAGEIVGQIVHVERGLRARDGADPQGPHALSNIVFMGMGEPLANYNEMLRAVAILNDEEGLNIGARRMTLSTVGLVPAIRRLAEEPYQVNLAVSLHSPIDEIRSELVPINRQYPISELMAAVRDYIEQSGRRVTYEYAMINDVNDSDEQAHALGALLEGTLAHVNLIPLNPVPGSPWPPSDPERLARFAGIVREYGISVTLRVRRGIDVAAGCGQLYAAVERRGRSIVTMQDYPSRERVEQVVAGRAGG